MAKKGKQYDNLCLLWATAPLREAEDIRQAYEILINTPEADGVVGVTEGYQYYSSHILDNQGYLKPVFSSGSITNLRGQDVPKTFVDNSSIGWVRCRAFFEGKTWLPKKYRGYYMPRYKSVDLDTPQDLELLSFYYSKYKKSGALPQMKKVFFDTEFTRSGQNTTLISIGFVSEDDKELYIELNDYDRNQVTPWLKENILPLLEGKGVSTQEAVALIEEWLEQIADGGLIQLVSAGKDLDLILLSNLWARVKPGSALRSWQDDLPNYIGHRYHIDLDTIFALNGINPEIERIEFLGTRIDNIRHKAIDDARLIKACWEKMKALGWVR
jgi:hypothetical protein